MTVWLKITVSCLIFLAGSTSCFSKDHLIISGHPEYPPIMWQQGNTITGAADHMARHIFKELGVPFEIKYTGPWKRVQKYAEKGIIDVILAAYKNPHRVTYMDCTDAFMADPVVIFVKKGRVFPFDKWEDLIGKNGNTNIGESYDPAFDQYIIDHLTIERVPKTRQNFMKLVAERSDYAIIGLYPGLASATVGGYKDKVTALSRPVLEEHFYMTFSKKSKYRHLIPQVNAVIKQLRAQSKIDLWINEYLTYYKSTTPQSPQQSPKAD